MDEMNKATVHASEVVSVRDMIQTPYSEFNVGADLPKVTEAELAKLAKRQEKEDRQRRLALERHQVIMPSEDCDVPARICQAVWGVEV